MARIIDGNGGNDAADKYYPFAGWNMVRIVAAVALAIFVLAGARVLWFCDGWQEREKDPVTHKPRAPKEMRKQ